MSVISAIPIIKELVRWIRNEELVEQLRSQINDQKVENTELKAEKAREVAARDVILAIKDKEILKYRRRIQKLEKM